MLTFTYTIPLKIAILVDSELVDKNVFDFIKWADSRDNLDISHLIIQNSQIKYVNVIERILDRVKKRGIKRLLASQTFKIITLLEFLMIRRNEQFIGINSKFNALDIVKNKIETNPIFSRNGISLTFNEADLNRISACNFDLIIRFGSGILKGHILNTPRLGIISFHHGDNRVNRGGPAGFWEVLSRSTTTGVIIQKLTEELDGGDVLSRGSYPTQHYYVLNQQFIYKRSMHLLQDLLSKISLEGSLPKAEDHIPYSNQLFTLPFFKDQFLYLFITAQYFLKELGKKIFNIRKEKWKVAYVEQFWRNAVLRKSKTIPPTKNSFLADPFIYKNSDQTTIFVEEYYYNEKIGKISAYEVRKSDLIKYEKIIDEDFHLSFPYVFHYDGNVYMCPETNSINEIRIYICTNYPQRWEYHKTLMKNVSAADSIIFEHSGKWWIFTNIDSSGMGDHCSELHIFSSDSPLSQNWTAHPQNPVIVDANIARNAGILRDGDKVYRVSQSHGFKVYGVKSSIREITFDSHNYCESEICVISPYINGEKKNTHHFFSHENFTVFDYK
ncbi:glucosamine inositolphosphorylceramide transferase family protein [Thalassospira xiamenensis]|uniref:Glucosamine inositolphosphorylceramide transferase 1 N-terminal domain-containing protein n=1 Tax=Thalassospira xiamenensis TaxID=220697 RepID=A0A285T663_9PROT|nr:hypothetical protein [Thalassospira xiamenensis]SOC16756.1 hypothetical protein SAMN05428964_102407 [Thalassospira xiamenensis]